MSSLYDDLVTEENGTYPGLAPDAETSEVEAGYTDLDGLMGFRFRPFVNRNVGGIGQPKGLNPFMRARLEQERQQREAAEAKLRELREKQNLPPAAPPNRGWAFGGRALVAKFLVSNGRTAKVLEHRTPNGAAIFHLQGGPGGRYGSLSNAEEAFTAWAGVQPPTGVGVPATPAVPALQTPAVTSITPPVAVLPPAPIVAPLPTPVDPPAPVAPPVPERPTVVPASAIASGEGWVWSGYDGNTPAIKAYFKGTTRSFGFGPESWGRATSWIAKGGVEGLSGLGWYRTRASRATSMWA